MSGNIANFVKHYNNSIYLCSYDYSVKLLIRDEFKDKYRQLVGKQGLFFQRQSSKKWELKSKNPYIRII